MAKPCPDSGSRRFRAAVLYETGAPLVIERDVAASSPGPGQVMVQIAYSGVCRSQLMEVQGRRGHDRYLPHMLGHEGSGAVVAVGEGVTKVKPGDDVVLSWIKGAGLDAPGPTYRSGARVINAGGVTTFSDLAVVSENRCTLCPAGLPLDIAALLGCAVLTGVGLVEREAAPLAGAEVAIFGLGGIGMSALMAAARRQPGKLIAVDVDPARLAMARELGATHLIDSREGDAADAVRHLTGGHGAQVVIEAAGLTHTIEQGFDAVRRGGLCVFASHPTQGELIRIDPFELIAGKRIRGSWGGGARPDEDIPRLAQAWKNGELPIAVLVNARYPLEQVNQALDDLDRGLVLRPLLDMSL